MAQASQNAFQSTLPGWGATAIHVDSGQFRRYFNPRSPDGEQPRARPASRMGHDFNPRSPDGERQSGLLVLGLAVDISIHAPRMGSDLDRTTAKASRLLFQSTLPGWGATVEIRTIFTQIRYFNPRSPDGERRHGWSALYSFSVFQSTLPGWGATRHHEFSHVYGRISIHAPRMGSDIEDAHVRFDVGDFNPRSPDGERPRNPINTPLFVKFQSTLPGWGATRWT